MVYIVLALLVAANIYAADDMLSSMLAKMLFSELMNKSEQQPKELTHEKQFLKDVKKGRCDKVRSYLTEHNNKIPAGALYHALKNQQKEVADILLEQGAYVNEEYKGYYPLHVAAECCPEYVERLLELGACVDSINKIQGATPLHAACGQGHDDACAKLMAKGASVHARNYDNSLPLHYAAVAGQPSVIEQLIAAGSDINAQNRHKTTPLIIAAYKEHKDATLKLIASGAVVNVQDHEGDTALHVAVRHEGWDDVVTKLIDQGAAVNTTNKKKQTPLHWATCKGNTSIATLLINRGADVWAQDSDGDIPLLIARHDLTKNILRNAMHNNNNS